MSTMVTACGFYLLDNNVSLSVLDGLPKRLSGLPRGAVNKLSSSGIIAKHGRILESGAYWRTWKAGPMYPAFRQWAERHRDK